MRLSDMLMQARKKRKCPTWMGETVWNDLEKIWMDSSFKEISNRAKKNRASSKGGAVCTGGSISIAEHTIRMAEELGRDLALDEVFLKTHTKKKDNSWVDERAKKKHMKHFKVSYNKLPKMGKRLVVVAKWLMRKLA
uniref:Uncharacterized protein LOC113783946 n=1 Tax=Cicer arietinum TaxID=3827 RepID=A0A3Q7YAR6_CICAR|nr:uncharacterized protein LOC113783946 [Cicer arietinum]